MDDLLREMVIPTPCRLLSLPAELRAMIFTLALEDVHCRYPILVWNHISIANTAGASAKGIGILLACKTTYQDCVDIIYDQATIHMSVRGDTFGRTPESGNSLGSIKNCPVLRRLKHIQLELSYKRGRSGCIGMVADRLQKLVEVFNKHQNLKTIDLVFFDEGSRFRSTMWQAGDAAHRIINAVMELECGQLVAVSRNEAALWNMTESKWKALREKAGEDAEKEEQFREITLDYWEHEFRLKN